MISCVLTGGLGNQLFQIAAAYALALRNNDISGFILNSCHTPLQGNPSNRYKENVLKNVNDINGYDFKYLYSEPNFSYTEIPYINDLILKGCYQSERYFVDYKDEIIELFSSELNNEFITEYLKKYSLPVTSVHIRRGDYMNNSDYHKPCSVEYYKEAMKIIGESTFIFISDDINWVKENFKGDNIIYSPFKSDVDDLTLMVKCDNNIIANSSFSWWGAYLNKNKDKKIIAPKEWFGLLGPKDTQDVIPKNWIKL
jgi:hypothetical protein